VNIIEIRVGVLECNIVTPLPTEIRDDLYEQLAYRVKDYQFMNLYNKKRKVVDPETGQERLERVWDGYKRLFRPRRQTFEAGLLSQVLYILDGWDCEYEIIEERPTYERPEALELQKLPTLWDHQEQIIAAIFGSKRLRIDAPPRSGKTLANIVFYARCPIQRMLFIVERRELVLQTGRAFKRYLPDIDVGRIVDGKVRLGEDVTVSTIQAMARVFGIDYDLLPGESTEQEIRTLEKRKQVYRYVSDARIVVIDECHHSAAPTYVDLLKRISSAEFVIGQSGTPFREDNTDLLMEAVLGPIAVKVSREDLVRKGILVQPKVRFYKLPRMAGLERMHYQTVYARYITHSPLRNHLIANCVNEFVRREKSVIVTVSKKPHGRLIKKVLDDMGVRSVLLYGDMKDKKERDDILKDLKAKRILVVISTLLDEGVDIPSLDAVIIAAGDKSVNKVLQRPRCLTAYPGKKFGYIVDFLDDAPYLREHSKKRLGVYERTPAFNRIDIKDLTDGTDEESDNDIGGRGLRVKLSGV